MVVLLHNMHSADFTDQESIMMTQKWVAKLCNFGYQVVQLQKILIPSCIASQNPDTKQCNFIKF